MIFHKKETEKNWVSGKTFDGLDVERGLVDVAEEGLLTNVLNPTSSLLKIVPGNQPKVFLKGLS